MLINKKTKLIYIVVALIMLICVILLIVDSSGVLVDQKNRGFLKKYGWDVESLNRSQKNVKMILDLETNYEKKNIEVSEKIGLRPKEYFGKPVNIYGYELTRLGKEYNLRAEIMTYKGKVVYAYISHLELHNVRLESWSLDTPYSQIVNDIEKLYKEAENYEINKVK